MSARVVGTAAASVIAIAMLTGWSTPAVYPEPVEAGGGGGRFFTGSSSDAFGCDVCHQGTTGPTLVVEGMPQRYEAGATYTLDVQWPSTSRRVSVLGEFVDEMGAGVGAVVAPPDDILLDAERCASGSRALAISDASDDREVFGIPACGATRVRVQWTAPARDVGPVWLHLGAVGSDDSDDPAGDGVTMFAVSLGDASHDAGCAAGQRPTRRGPWMLFALLLLRARRRR